MKCLFSFFQQYSAACHLGCFSADVLMDSHAGILRDSPRIAGYTCSCYSMFLIPLVVNV